MTIQVWNCFCSLRAPEEARKRASGHKLSVVYCLCYFQVVFSHKLVFIMWTCMYIFSVLWTTLCQGVVFTSVSCELQGFSNFSHKCSVAQSSGFGLRCMKTVFLFLNHFCASYLHDWVHFTWLWVACINISCMVTQFEKKAYTASFMCKIPGFS